MKSLTIFTILIFLMLSGLTVNTFENNKRNWKDDIIKILDNSLINEIITVTSNVRKLSPETECIICKQVMGLFQIIFDSAMTKNEIESILQFICVHLHIQTAQICHGIIPEFKQEILTVFDKLVLSPNNFCGTLLGESCAKVHHPHEFWNISLNNIPKPPINILKYPKPGLKILRILQLSDIHISLDYKVKGNANCGEPVCCREIDGKPNGIPAGKWGDYRQCDTPLKTFDNLLQHLKKYEKFDVIYWTGDLPGHVVWNQTKDDQLNLLDFLTKRLLLYFPGVPIFSALGNHESSPVNSFPPPYINDSNSIDWLYNRLRVDWGNWLPKDTFKTVNYGAFYTVVVRKGLRLISINTNYCNNENWWMLLNATDPAGQLQWLIDVLQHAEDNKEKVHIIGHIPPGSGVCLQPWSWNYYKIVNRYESTIVAQFFGHTHTDFFEIFYEEKRPTNIAYISPSVTTYPNLNPGYRIYTVDGEHENTTWSVIDHETHVLDLQEANRTDNPIWKLTYKAKEFYHLKTLFPNDWNNLITQMERNRTLFEKFYVNIYKQSPARQLKCDDNCKFNWLCDLKSAKSNDPSLCQKYFSESEYNKYFIESLKRHQC